ncbi:UNVERIFIED_CONTAM: Ammonium transporter 3 member 2 [Sesamum calycinum]|uniref:Ammonium transporter 3 member 2 n=1 Tax=Sesamum calycinum TaxID=2727403 RepID=A0AAW2SEH5_9LAMI
MGLLSGSIPWYTMMVLQKKLTILKKVDNTLGILHTHPVAGILGGILTGLLAEPKLARLFYLVDDWQHFLGSFYGLKSDHARARQLGVQLLRVVFVVCWNILITSLICFLIKLVAPLRLSDVIIEKGDESMHGEEAYALYGDGERPDNYKQVNNYLICYKDNWYKFRVQILSRCIKFN